MAQAPFNVLHAGVVAVTLASILFASAVQATTVPQYGFDFAVNSFEAQGNVTGDPQLEFNDGDPTSFNPTGFGGIADQEDGALHLRVLDTKDSLLFSQLNPGRVIRESAATSSPRIRVSRGQGAYTATSFWESAPDAGNSGYSMGVQGGIQGTSHLIMQSISITLRDYSPEFVTAPFAGGAGLVATIEHTTSTATPISAIAGPSRIYTSFKQFALPIDRDSITGPIGLRLSSDATGRGPFTAEISIDGGQTFEKILGSIVLDGLWRTGDVFLSGHEVISAGDDDPTAPVPEPSVALLLMLGLIGIGWGRGSRRQA